MGAVGGCDTGAGSPIIVNRPSAGDQANRRDFTGPATRLPRFVTEIAYRSRPATSCHCPAAPGHCSRRASTTVDYLMVRLDRTRSPAEERAQSKEYLVEAGEEGD